MQVIYSLRDAVGELISRGVKVGGSALAFYEDSLDFGVLGKIDALISYVANATEEVDVQELAEQIFPQKELLEQIKRGNRSMLKQVNRLMKKVMRICNEIVLSIDRRTNRGTYVMRRGETKTETDVVSLSHEEEDVVSLAPPEVDVASGEAGSTLPCEDVAGEEQDVEPEDDGRLSLRQRAIVAEIGRNRRTSASRLARRLGVTARTVQRDLARLCAMGVVWHEGRTSGGEWRVEN